VKERLTFAPTFTTKALGLKPLEVSQAQARKLVQKIQTGFEVRRGVIVKNDGGAKRGVKKKKLKKKITQKKRKANKLTLPRIPKIGRVPRIKIPKGFK